MKQKHDVSIAGIAFQLDDEGYLLLDNYLSQIAAIYKNNPDGAEVLADIEGRICELILERQPADRPVPIELLRHIVEQLGIPDSFPEETTPTPNSHVSNSTELGNASVQTDSQSHTSSNTSGKTPPTLKAGSISLRPTCPAACTEMLRMLELEVCAADWEPFSGSIQLSFVYVSCCHYL